jgi:hypothetical protein
VDLSALRSRREEEYRPSNRRFLVTSRNYTAEEDCVTLTQLPPGDHVLSVVTDRKNPDSVSSLAHLVVF